MELGGCKGSGKGGIGIAIHKNKVRLFLYEDLFGLCEDLSRLFPVRTGSHVQVIVRLGDMQFFKKDVRHLWVIMLAGMDEDLGMILTQFP